ncbi:MAG: AAA family ATPase [Candidatus Micrarchaeota archaeon]|nr:AAA family ATPase [Candidatus Micrarchaeota archaeon]MDE1833867.1 AAA family ATPase [Candidatus Micrarchaeota archaeon]MDE1859354.1 AAA family ATPase [Candidatus Micrarchaeota archaeon]
MKRVIVITGTPATGKTSVAEKLAKALDCSELIKANDIVKKKKLFTSKAADGAMVARMDKLGKEINSAVKKSKADFVIVEGHLLCDMRVEGAVAVVMREHLKTLLKRLKERRYSRQKIEDNIVSEGIDYCGVNALKNYKEVYEIENGPGAMEKIIEIANGKRIRTEEIEMLGELNALLSKL